MPVIVEEWDVPSVPVQKDNNTTVLTCDSDKDDGLEWSYTIV